MEFDPASIIKNFGFPALMCLWFMLRTDKRLDNVAAALTRLTMVNRAMAESLDLAEEQRKLLEDQ